MNYLFWRSKCISGTSHFSLSLPPCPFIFVVITNINCELGNTAGSYLLLRVALLEPQQSEQENECYSQIKLNGERLIKLSWDSHHPSYHRMNTDDIIATSIIHGIVSIPFQCKQNLG